MSLNEENIQWKDEFSIGNLEIDKEHQKLFSLAKLAFKISQYDDEEKMKEELKNLIDELTFYTSTHFENEKEFMRRIHFPQIKEHIQSHKIIHMKLNALIKQLSSMQIKEVHEAVANFIEKYFINHIIQEDIQIKIWYNRDKQNSKEFPWKQCYNTNITHIDKRNQSLLQLATKAYEKVYFKERDTKITAIINELYDYMKYHFKEEEKLMKENNYPYAKEHIALHRGIIQSINRFVIQLPHANEEHFEKELAYNIENIFVKHLIEEDESFRQYLSNLKSM